MDEESKYFMVVTADNWLEVWAIGFYSREKAQYRVNTGYFLKYAMPELKDRVLQVITHREHIEFKNNLKNGHNKGKKD